MPKRDDEATPSDVHKPRSAADKKKPTYCHHSTDHAHHPKVIRREFNQVTTDHLKMWPSWPRGVHLREYVECADCGKYAVSERDVIHESMVMYHITSQDRPVLPCRLVEKDE